MTRALPVLVVAAFTGLPAAAGAQAPAAPSDVRIEFAQAPRLTQALPVTIWTTGPASYQARAEVRVGGRAMGAASARGRSETRGTLIRFRVPRSTRTRAVKAARTSGRPPEVVVTVSATLDGRPGAATASIRSALRRAPFYDGRLRAPDASAEQNRRFGISWDLPFEFTQLYGALEGTPSAGSFRKYVRARKGAPACSITFHGAATTTRTPGRLRQPVRQRGTAGAWRFERGSTQALLTMRAPARLPGTRRWVVVHFDADASGSAEACAGEVDRTVLAALRRAIRTVTIRYAPPQLGPGYEIF